MRLNNFCIYGYEKDVGIKRTYVVRTYDIRPTACHLPHIIPPEQNKGISGLQDNRLEDVEECIFSPQFKAQHFVRCPEYSRYKKCVDISSKMMSECRQECGYVKGWVTTGALAIWYAVQHWGTIDICGFDCLQGDVELIRYGYYYMPDEFPKISGRNHFLDLEAGMVKRMADSGKINILRA